MVEAGRTLTYVETVDSSKADTLHRQVKKLYEEDLQHNFEIVVRNVLKKFKVKKVELAVDTHGSLYWGKNAGLKVRQIKRERGTNEAWEWVVISMVKPVPLPLMALPYKQGSDLASLTINLLKYAMSLPFKIKLCLFDRGFYNGHLIDFLEAKQLPYLMLVPANKAMKKYAELTNIIKDFKHTIVYKREKSTWKARTKIVVAKKVRDFNLYFATSLPTSLSLVWTYPRRWQIETNFRVIKEAKIKSKSNHSIIRYFYFMVQLLLHLAWNLTKKVFGNIQFKRYLAELVEQFRLLQGVT